MNVPYPPFLGDKREIDLIIAPEYSAGNMFEVSTCVSVHLKPVHVYTNRPLATSHLSFTINNTPLVHLNLLQESLTFFTGA